MVIGLDMGLLSHVLQSLTGSVWSETCDPQSWEPSCLLCRFLFMFVIVFLGQILHVLHSFPMVHLFFFFLLLRRRVSQVSANLCAESLVSAILLLVSSSFFPPL